MKAKLSFVLLGVVLLALALNARATFAQGPAPRAPRAEVGTAFTYQGQLKTNGNSHNGLCDFGFRLLDDPSAGVQIGMAQSVPNVSVVSGLFTTQLDFGASIFTGAARWLEISVRCPAGGGSYTALTPRQKLTPAPYALALPGLWTQQHTTSPNLIGGYSGNSVTAGVYGATIGGGGESGNTNRVTDNYGTVGGGRNNQAGDNAGTTSDRWYATVGGGHNNTASNTYATVGGGYGNTASGNRATVPGGIDASATHYGEMAYASGRFATAGDAQTSTYVLRRTTSNATATELFLDGSSARITLATDRAMTFDILIVGRSDIQGLSGGYHIRGVIERTDSGTTQFVGSPTVIALGEDDATWNVTVEADNTNDALVVKVTGSASDTVRWVATVRTAEVNW